MKPSNDREAVSLIIDGLIDRGVKITSVVDAENEEFAYENKEQAMGELMSCDYGTMNVELPDGTETWVWFVYGNDPEEVAADHGVSLSEYIDPIVSPWWE